MKIAIIGAGSYVFTPTALRDAIEKHRLDDAEIVLVDLDATAAETMCGYGRRMAQDLGVRCRLSHTIDRRAALAGADFAILCASPQGLRRWTMDTEILLRHNLADQSRECGGLGGLSNALRSITLALDVARDMEKLCPRAVLLDVTNPMPRVVTAVRRFSSIPAFGFCNAAQGGRTGYERVAQWVRGVGPGEPAVEAARSISVLTAGLNHFAWVLSVRDRASGRDLMPLMLDAVSRIQDRSGDVLRRWLAQYGAVAAAGNDHTGEFLPPQPGVHYHTTSPFHGSGPQREEYWRGLREAAAGTRSWQDVTTIASWEHPVDLAVALCSKSPHAMPMLNFPNDGCMPQLPAGRIVEAPVQIDAGIVKGLPVTLPDGVAKICRAVSDVHELAAEGAARRSRSLLRQAVEIDPAIPDKTAALAALDEMLSAHADICNVSP